MARLTTTTTKFSPPSLLLVLLTSTTFVHAQDISGSTDGSSTYGMGSWSGYQNYYFVSIALVLCALGVAVYFYIKRKRAPLQNRWSPNSSVAHAHGQPRFVDPQTGVAYDASHTRRRYWQGRWRMEPRQNHVEEGLNEHGEAPPPYIPKTQMEGVSSVEAGSDGAPAIPLQTLRREDVGLAKPPDYSPPVVTTTITNANGQGEGQNGGQAGMAERSARFA